MAEKMTSKELTKLLEGILCPHGFIKKGSAFFRLHGDGVLQTLKWIYEAHMGAHILYFGLLSMYGKILPQWLTSAGCIPSCDAMLLVDQNYYDIKLGFGDWEVSFLHGKVYTAGTTDRNVKNSSEFETLFQIAKTEMFHRIDPEVQLLTFKEIVLPTLNQIDTQSNTSAQSVPPTFCRKNASRPPENFPFQSQKSHEFESSMFQQPPMQTGREVMTSRPVCRLHIFSAPLDMKKGKQH